MPRMKDLCSQAGVALVLTRELPKSGANGATRWLGPNKGLVQLSLKWKWGDVFWFTFFHEAGHILLHQNKSFVEGVPVEDINRTEEDEADQFAADCLVPPEEWSGFVAESGFNEQRIRAFADGIGVHPGIVVGRLHHSGLLPYNRLAGIKDRFAWVE